MAFLGSSYIHWIFLFLLSVTHLPAYTQPDTVGIEQHEKVISSFGAVLQKGFIFAHSQAVQNTKGASPTGIETSIGWQRTDSAIWSLCNCFPRKGILLSYYDYDSDILGKGIMGAYFLEPFYRLSRKMSFSLRGASGLTYLTNPYDSIRNPSNQSYSTAISVYLLLGVGAWYQVADHWKLNLSANYQHISNGGMREPNKGINWLTAGLAVVYERNPAPFYKGIRTKEKFWKAYGIDWTFSLFGTARRDVNDAGKSQRLLLIGKAIQATKQVGRINNLTLGTEISYDQELRLQLKKDTISASAVLHGIMAGHEFILGKFLFSQQLGIYTFNQTPYYDRLYQRWGLQYKIRSGLGLGFTLKAHRQVADYADLRISYSFGKQKIHKKIY